MNDVVILFRQTMSLRRIFKSGGSLMSAQGINVVTQFLLPPIFLHRYRMEVGAYAWICARACVAPGVKVGEGAVLGLASIATRDLEPWGVYGGAPAVKL